VAQGRSEGPSKGNGQVLPFVRLIDAGEWLGHEPKPRLFLDGSSRLLPMRNVTLLGGDGGTGKSLLALQLALACCTAIPRWIGMEVTPGPVLYVSCEDNEAEIHRRVREICAAEEGSDIEAIRGRLFVVDMSKEDATLAVERQRSGLVEPTAFYRKLMQLIADTLPVLVVLDTLADVYSGNENSRPAVRHFLSLLRRPALDFDLVMLLLGHPSITGRASGTGESGSTAWNNSVRSRLYLKAGADDDDSRVLETKKANFSKAGGIIGLKWVFNRFVRKEVPKAADKMSMDTQDLIRDAAATGQYRAWPNSEGWLGFWLADQLGVDVGQGVPATDRTPLQKQARNEVMNLLKQFESGGVIHKVVRKDNNRELRPYYEGGPAPK
jgi:KaiC/GvpD/RAD55 family RecA-like ATPase